MYLGWPRDPGVHLLAVKDARRVAKTVKEEAGERNDNCDEDLVASSTTSPENRLAGRGCWTPVLARGAHQEPSAAVVAHLGRALAQDRPELDVLVGVGER